MNKTKNQEKPTSKAIYALKSHCIRSSYTLLKQKRTMVLKNFHPVLKNLAV